MPDPALQPHEIVRTSERLWSVEVGIAEAGEVVQRYPVAYEFSNGRKFIEKVPAHARPDPED